MSLPPNIALPPPQKNVAGYESDLFTFLLYIGPGYYLDG